MSNPGTGPQFVKWLEFEMFGARGLGQPTILCRLSARSGSILVGLRGVEFERGGHPGYADDRLEGTRCGHAIAVVNKLVKETLGLRRLAAWSSVRQIAL